MTCILRLRLLCAVEYPDRCSTQYALKSAPSDLASLLTGDLYRCRQTKLHC